MGVSVYTPDSTKILHTAYADFVSRQIGRTVHIVQYDDGLPILAVKLFSDGQPYTIPVDADVNIRLGKPDKTFVYNKALGCDAARHTVYFEITYQMVVLSGELSPVVEVIVGSAVSASSSISILIDRNPIQNGSVESTSEWKMIQDAVEYAKEAVDAAANASASRSASKISEDNAKRSETNAEASARKAAESEKAASASADNAAESEKNAKASEEIAVKSEYEAKVAAGESESYKTMAKSYAVGGTGWRRDEDHDNAGYYCRQSETNAADAKTSEYEARYYSLLSRSYATGDAESVVGDADGNELGSSDGDTFQLFFREGEEIDNARAYSEAAKQSETNASASEKRAEESANAASRSELAIKSSEETCASQAKLAQSYTKGNTGLRENEDTDCAEYYYEQVKKMGEGIGSGLLPMGSVAFSELESQTKTAGYVYEITDGFETDDRFRGGSGIVFPPGTSVYYTQDGLWACLSGSNFYGARGAAEETYQTGYVTITPDGIGAYPKESVDALVQGLSDAVSALSTRIDELEQAAGFVHILTDMELDIVTNDDKIILAD